MNTAAKVRLEKDRHPERFCAVKSCLWRIHTSKGPNPCRKHPVIVTTQPQQESHDNQ